MSDQFSFEDEPHLIELRGLWERVLQRLKGQVPETVLCKFLEPLEPESFNDDVAHFKVPGQFLMEWIKDKYIDLLEQAMAEEHGSPVRVQLTAKTREKPERERPAEPERAQPVRVFRAPQSFTPNPLYTFDSFVVGQSNRLAVAGCRAVTDAPGAKFNPLFIYGPSGVGKTHLLHSIGNQFARGASTVNVHYVTAQQFAEDFVTALQNDRIEQFRKAHRGVGVLLLDDVQLIAGKERTQEELFHTFNYLRDIQKQIVFCSDRPPRDLLLMDERLRSRLESGLVADIQFPDTEMRCAIVQKKAEQDSIPLTHEVAMLLATKITGNVRILEGALTKIVAQASLDQVAISPALAEDILDRYYSNAGAEKPSFDQILTVVSRHFKISKEAIKGASRKAPVAHARHVAVYITREMTGDSWKHIGAEFGNRDHTSVLHGYRKIQTQMQRDRDLHASVSLLMSHLRPEA